MLHTNNEKLELWFQANIIIENSSYSILPEGKLNS